jgi:hypothetical protein
MSDNGSDRTQNAQTKVPPPSRYLRVEKVVHSYSKSMSGIVKDKPIPHTLERQSTHPKIHRASGGTSPRRSIFTVFTSMHNSRLPEPETQETRLSTTRSGYTGMNDSREHDSW